jgi:heme exporter protein A
MSWAAPLRAITATSPDASPAGVWARALTCRFDGRRALRGVDLDVPPGSVTGVLGPNGAGKTTLLRVLATLQRPSDGHARVGGFDIARAGPDVRRSVGWVGHQTLAFPDLTAEENLRLYGRLYGVQPLAEHVTAVLQAVGLWPRRGDRARVLSRGLQQRLAIARALVHQPTVLLLDEPHTGLDPASADRLDDLLRAQARLGRAVVVTSHDLARAHALADQLVILRAGRVAWSGAAQDVALDDLMGLYRRLTRAGAEGDAADAMVTPAERAEPAPPRAAAGVPAPIAPPGPGVAAALGAVLWKDVLVELRAREVVPPVVVFGLVVLVVFHFTVAVEPRLAAAVAPGALWVALVFGSMLGLARLMGADVDTGCLTGLLASPADRGGLYLGKWLAGYVFSLVVAAVLLPAFVVLLNLPPVAVLPLAGVVALGLVGWQAAGTLTGALAVSARAREVLLPVLLFPVVLPLLIAAVQASAGVLAGTPVRELAAPLALMTAYSVIFLVVGFLLYPVIVEASS